VILFGPRAVSSGMSTQERLLLGLALLSVACGSSTEEPSGPSACGKDWDLACDRAGCDPNAAAWQDCRINGWAGYSPPPYCNAETGFAGDDSALCAPDPEEGFQLHYGPTRYDDPSDFERWVLPPGGESMDCLFVRAPDVPDRFIGQLIGRSRSGSHHLQLSYAAAADDTRPEGEVGPCGSIAGTQFIAIAQTPELDVPDLSIPKPAGAPDTGGLDFAGSSAPFDAGRMMELTVHFLNTGSTPMLKEAWVNIYYRERSEVVRVLNPITFVSFGIDVPPRSSGVAFRRSCSTTVPRTIKYLQGHAHVGMQRFTAWQHSAATNELTRLYENYDPVEPATLLYSDLTSNPEPDRARGVAGGVSGPIELAAGDSLVWECEFDNPEPQRVGDGGPGQGGQMCYTFGGWVSPDGGPDGNWICAAATPSEL
jgi:hypothetical protein